MAQDSLHLDMDVISELKQVMGGEFSLLIETFESDSVLRIEALKQAVACGQPDLIRRAAHSFKGSAGNMGAIVLTGLCRNLEEKGFEGETDGCEQLLEQLIDEYQRVQLALNAL